MVHQPDEFWFELPLFWLVIYWYSLILSVFSGVCEGKNHAHNDWTLSQVVMNNKVLGGFRMNWTNGRKNSPNLCLAQSNLCADWDTSLDAEGEYCSSEFSLLSIFVLFVTSRDRTVCWLDLLSSLRISTFSCW